MSATSSSQRAHDLRDCIRLVGDADHPLLALRDHDLDGLHVGLAERHAVEVDVEADAASRHLGEGGRKARRAEVLQRLDEAALHEREARLDQLLAREGVADLDGRALVLVVVGELLAREHARAADPVASRGRAEEDDVVAGPARLGARHAVGREEPDAHRVDERVRRVAVVEDRVAADGGDADAVAVVADAADRAAELEPGLAEAQAVEERDRDARPWRRCRGGSRRPPSPRPGRARPRTDGCGSRP